MEDDEKKARAVFTTAEMNTISADVLKLLRSKKVRPGAFSALSLNLKVTQYPHPIADAYSLSLQTSDKGASDSIPQSANGLSDTVMKRTGSDLSHVDTPDVPIRFSEKKRLDWAGKTCECTPM